MAQEEHLDVEEIQLEIRVASPHQIRLGQTCRRLGFDWLADHHGSRVYYKAFDGREMVSPVEHSITARV